MAGDAVQKVSVVIPVRNEAVMLARTAPALKRALKGFDCQVIYVLNGTTDSSAAVIASVFGDEAEVLVLEVASKTGALNAGDAAAEHFPRVYLDADIAVGAGDISRLLAPILADQADMTAGVIVPDVQKGSRAAQEVARIWGALPYAKTRAYQCCVALSSAGRGAWEDWLDVIADDLFMAAQILQDRKRICEDVETRMPLPKRLDAWIGVRTRWIQGQRQFEAHFPGQLPKAEGQRNALLGLAVNPRNWVGIGLYVAVWWVAKRRAMREASTVWYRDETQRQEV